jgi:hypothetical protein
MNMVGTNKVRKEKNQTLHHEDPELQMQFMTHGENKQMTIK